MLTSILPPEIRCYFPYPSVRPYQDRLIKSIYDATLEGRNYAGEAANGLGKTIAVLSAVLPVAKEHGFTILYTARTHKQHDRVIDELRAISKKTKVTGISLRGRSSMCLHPLILRHASDARSAMEVCSHLKELERCPYYRNMDEQFERCSNLQIYLRSRPSMALEICEICRKEKFCPYELTKLVIGEVDVVALSYIYILEPNVRDNFFKYLSKPIDKTILIIDEAHNFPSTALEIASDQLTIFTIRQAEQEAKRNNKEDIATFCRHIEKIVTRTAKHVKEELSISPERFLEAPLKETRINDFPSFLDYMLVIGDSIRRNQLMHGEFPRSYINSVAKFFVKWLYTVEDSAFSHILSKYKVRGGVTSSKLEIVALDPRKVTEPIISSVHCTISISGTLEPIEAYTKIIGLPDDTLCEALPSPFLKEHILPLACTGISTSLERRTPEMYKKIARRISEAIRYTPGNVGVFTASYEVLEGLIDAGFENMIDKRFFHEQQTMSSRQNDLLLRRFKSYADKGGAILLGVQGGRNSEGEDYPGSQMTSVVIVGVPYAKPLPRVEAQTRYFEKQFPGHGHEYGYVIPALKKASQASGRPIRTLEDRGAIIFLDYRFSTAYCRKYLPVWIRKNLKILPDEDGAIARELLLFFGLQ